MSTESFSQRRTSTNRRSAGPIAAYKLSSSYNKGVGLLQAGRVYPAIQEFHEASFFEPDNALPIVALAECYVFLCDLRSAVRCYRRALWFMEKKPYESNGQEQVRLSMRGDDAVSAPPAPSSSAEPSQPVGLSSDDYDDEAPPSRSPIHRRTTATVLSMMNSTGTLAGDERLSASYSDEQPAGRSDLAELTATPETFSSLNIFQLRKRLAGILDALSIALFHTGDSQQALRCSTEALTLYAANQPALKDDRTWVLLSEPKIALHRCIFLLAQQGDEEAERLLERHYERYPLFQEQSASMLIEIYCNRQAFRKARQLLEKEEKQPRGTGVVSADAETDSAPPRAPSTIVAKYLFTVKFSNYRSKALDSNDRDSITRCIDVAPDDIELLFRRAQLLIAEGKDKQSVKDLFKCIRETNGSHKEAMEAMTSVLFRIGSSLDGTPEMTEAVQYYSESLKWRPDNVLVLLARGDCYVKLEDYEKALADYRAVQQINPNNSESQERIAFLHDLWGRKFYAMDRAEEAEQEFTNAIKTNEKEPLFFYHRAMCRLKLNQPRYALRDVLSCKELNPSNPRLQAFITRYLGPIDTVGSPKAGVMTVPSGSTRSPQPRQALVQLDSGTKDALPQVQQTFCRNRCQVRIDGSVTNSGSTSNGDAFAGVQGCRTTIHARQKDRQGELTLRK